MLGVKKSYQVLCKGVLALLFLYLQMASLYAQEQKKYFVTIQVKNDELKKVFDIIREQTALIVSGTDDLLDLSRKVSFVANKEELTSVLSRLVQGKGLICEIRNGKINIKKDDHIPVLIVNDSLISISGLITNTDGVPISGTAIKVSKGIKGTITDQNGQFSITGINKNDDLFVHAMGYWDQKISITGKHYFPIIMSPKPEFVDQVVVIAYGTSTRRFTTGSISSVNMGNNGPPPLSNLLYALTGRVPGLLIVENSGMPGANATVQLRGLNSIRNNLSETGNSPLYIIDGVPYKTESINLIELSSYLIDNNNPSNGISPLNSLNPADIQSIEVLKDADATSIYGSRGANCVILITTKRAREGSILFDATLYKGIARVTRKMNLLNTSQYLAMRNEAVKNEGPGTSEDDDINGTWDKNRYTDWQKELIGGVATFKDGQVSISGGNKKVKFLLGGGYHKETTVFPGDFSSERISTHLNVMTGAPWQRFKSDFSLNYSDGRMHLLGADITNLALTLAPNAPSLYTPDHKLNWKDFSNPLASINRPYDNIIRNLIASLMLSYRIYDSLTFKINIGGVNSVVRETKKRFKSSFSPQDSVDKALKSMFGKGEIKSWNIEPQLTYKLKHGKAEWNFLSGATFQREVVDNLLEEANGFQFEWQMDDVNQVADSNILRSHKYSEYKYAAIFGRIGYNYNSQFIANLSGRRDASSRYGNNKLATFGAIGLAWIFSKQKIIIDNLPILNFAKLRASYGITGNDQIPDYEYLGGYTSDGSEYDGIPALYPSRLPNTDYKWQKSRKAELALELQMLDSKIMTTIAVYRNRTNNQLVRYTLPPTTGFESIQYNQSALVQNAGVELELKNNNLHQGYFNWSTSFNLSINKNKLISFPDLANSPYADRLVIGKPVSIVKLYKSLHVDPQTGLYQVEDVPKNGIRDGVYNAYDQQSYKDIAPKFFGGLLNEITYKSIRIDVFFQFVKQNGYNYRYNMKMPGLFNQNQPVGVLDRWQSPGDIKNIQKFSNSTISAAWEAQNLNNSSTDLITDASYIRLKSVSVTYQLPQRWLKRLHIEAAGFFIKGQNLLTITKYQGLDPENQYRGQPPLKVMAMGFSTTF